MARIHKIEPIVKKVLTEQPESRGDDFILILNVLKYFVATSKYSLEQVFIYHKKIGLPSLETITRCRRKIQEQNPALRDEAAAAIRAQEQESFKNYARQ